MEGLEMMDEVELLTQLQAYYCLLLAATPRMALAAPPIQPKGTFL